MAASSSSFSYNSNPTSFWKYHVFLSFRGEDNRLSFTDHLYSALWRKGIITFRDDEQLEKGEIIKQEILQAIDESLYAIVILSQNYACSVWCLDELQKILESRKVLGKGVLPIFYGIDPSTVRHQAGSFAEAFRRHEERFGETKVLRWRDALSEVANLSGYHSRNRPEAELIEEMITVLWKKLKPDLASYFNDGLYGIDKKLEDMYQILEIGSSEVFFVGIWGMGGIGKTTLAIIVFKQLCRHFDVSCCIENVREKSNAMDGLLGLQVKLLANLKIRNLEIDNLDQGKAVIRNLLFHKKVLLLLDDVDEIRQLDYLAGNQDWFGQGSRVIVTTRDMHILESHEASFRKYEIEVLNINESLELFHHRAFKRNQPKEGYLKLSQTVVHYGQGLPLALEVLGSLLCGRDISIWEDVISRIRKHPPKSILDTLRISYEGLEDAERTLFLDMACFFKGWHKDRVIQILKYCGFNHDIGIQILIERSLLKCSNEYFWMHDLLEEMGKKVVIQKSGNDINKESRLWSTRDIDEVLEKNKGTEFIEGIVLGAHKYEAHWDPKAFSKICNLRMLIVLRGFPLSLGLQSISDSIKVLEWNGYPLKSLPECEKLRKLVELKLCGSKVKQLWNDAHNFEELKFIDLSYSKDLTHSPNFVGAQNLESLILKGCSNLVEIHQSVGQLKKLVILNLKDCLILRCLPRKLEMNSLKDLILFGCSTLKKLPEFGESMESMSVLDLSGCNNLICLPRSISNLKYLRNLNISGCSKIFILAENMNKNKALERLDLSESTMIKVPSVIYHLNNLEGLSFHGFKGHLNRLWGWKFGRQRLSMDLKMVPLSSFSMLRQLDASFCNLSEGSFLNHLSCLSSLENINLSGNNFANLPSNCFSNLSRLRKLDLSFCPKLQSLPMFPPSLRQVSARNCGQMGALPDEELWKLFMLDEIELQQPLWFGLIGGRQYAISIPRSEIPTWFDIDKQKNFLPLENSDLIIDSDPWHSPMSFVVDIPDYCRSNNSKWWGIVVCFLFEPMICAQPRDTKHTLFLWRLCCQYKSPEIEVCPYDDRRTRWYTLGDMNRGLNFHHQFIILLSGNDEFIQEVLKEGHNQVKIFFVIVRSRRSTVFENVKVSKCAWRVIYKDEVNTKFQNMASSSTHMSCFKKARFTEISSNEEDATATGSNEEFLPQQKNLKRKILD